MAYRAKYEGNNLVWLTGAIMVAVSLYEGSKGVAKSVQKGHIHGAQVNQQYTSTTKQLLAIGLLVIVMSIVMDQAPEFGKPFAILVLVAFLTMKTPVIKDYFNTTQGTTK